MTVSTPFSAPAWPPETGASRKPKPRAAAFSASSRATSAEAVVLSMKTAPFFIAWKAPSWPIVTARRSSSLPTQEKTKSLPAAASRGVAANAPPMLGDPFLGLGGGAVVDGDVVAALVLEVAGHRIAHHAKTDECDRCHFR